MRDHHHDHWGDNNFWNNHPGLHWRYHTGFHPWAWAAWGSLAGWVGSGWTDPVYYNYGDNVYYDDGQVYYGEEPIATTEEYAQQAQQLVDSAPEVNQDSAEWLPLGVFALTQDGQASGPEPTMFLQLAINKQGVISGTFQNTATDKVFSVEGMVDKKTQRTAWGPVGKKWPIMETGIHNLTENTAPALLHFENGDTQQWLLVRLDDPASAAGGGKPAPK
ncbi:MAG: hypothetical protein K8T91_19100 [Planctomycetes bacterium]|nr:hypothetical protein [Planctomycetota bacterium]